MPIHMLKLEKNLFNKEYPYDYINPKKIIHILFGKQYIMIQIEILGMFVFGKTKHNLEELKKIGIEGENIYVV